MDWISRQKFPKPQSPAHMWQMKQPKPPNVSAGLLVVEDDVTWMSCQQLETPTRQLKSLTILVVK